VQVQHLSWEIGRAIGKLTTTPLPAPGAGYSPIHEFALLLWGPRLSQVLSAYLAICRRVQTAVAAYQEPFFAASLALLDAQVAVVDGQRQLLFHEDISNVRVEGAHFRAFYDLEMCRLGTEMMQLGVALGLCGDDGLCWSPLLAGYEEEVGYRLAPTDLAAVLAMHQFYHWIRVCQWGDWDGDPAQEAHRQAAATDAAYFRQRMQQACTVLAESSAVAAQLGSL
jgi:hypothetical protein